MIFIKILLAPLILLLAMLGSLIACFMLLPLFIIVLFDQIWQYIFGSDWLSNFCYKSIGVIYDSALSDEPINNKIYLDDI